MWEGLRVYVRHESERPERTPSARHLYKSGNRLTASDLIALSHEASAAPVIFKLWVVARQVAGASLEQGEKQVRRRAYGNAGSTM